MDATHHGELRAPSANPSSIGNATTTIGFGILTAFPQSYNAVAGSIFDDMMTLSTKHRAPYETDAVDDHEVANVITCARG